MHHQALVAHVSRVPNLYPVKQKSMITGLGTDDIGYVERIQQRQVREVGSEAVFDHECFQMLMFVTKIIQKVFRRITLTIIFIVAVALDYGLRSQRITTL